MNNLRRTILLSLLAAVVVVLPATAQAAEQETSATKMTERWVCLNVVHCHLDKKACSGKGVVSHRTKLSADASTKLLPNADTYVIECVSTPQGQVCTTGNATTDTKIFQSSSNLTTLGSAVNYVFQGFFQKDGQTAAVNPAKSTSTGELGPYEWQSASKFTTRKFLALNYVEPTYQTGLGNSQQQGTFDLNISTNDCLSVRYDPYGIVFDSQTLEPIKGARVQLFEKTASGYQLAGNSNNTQGINPTQVTEEDGVYNYVVEPGTYKVTAAMSGYVFPAALDRVNQYYKRAYSDLYPAVSTVTPTPPATAEERDYDIVETSDIVHRDIPLDPNPVTANRRYPVKIMDYYYQLKDKYSTIVTVEGRVSHPYSKIKLYTVAASAANPENAQPMTLLATVQATREGKFRFEVDQSKLKPGEKLGKMVPEKVDLSSGMSFLPKVKQTIAFIMGLFVKPAHAQQNANASDVGLEPILNYVEGYAYDAQGNKLPNARVGVYLKFSQKPYYETKSDETGYFRVTSEYLPFMPYDLRYVSATGVVAQVSTSTFIEQNQDTIKEKNIDLYTFRNSKGETITATPKPSEAASGSNTGGANQNVTPTPAAAATNQNMIMIVAIIVFLVVAGAIIAVYMMKKKSEMPPQRI